MSSGITFRLHKTNKLIAIELTQSLIAKLVKCNKYQNQISISQIVSINLEIDPTIQTKSLH